MLVRKYTVTVFNVSNLTIILGAFGPCHRGDVHWRRNCVLCNGSGSVHAGYRPCNMCQAKGATGAFGPCTQEDVHFRSLCHVCNGKCYIYDTPSYPQPVYPQPVYSQPVQPVHVHHHHHGHSGHHQVTFSSHSGSSVTCPVCTGKGGIGKSKAKMQSTLTDLLTPVF